MLMELNTPIILRVVMLPLIYRQQLQLHHRRSHLLRASRTPQIFVSDQMPYSMCLGRQIQLLLIL